MATATPTDSPTDDDPVMPTWVEYVTIGMGLVVGILLFATAFDSVRRIRQIDRELTEFVDVPRPGGLSVVDTDGAA
jgi:hypothetical protein